jgi:hypothetical protein
MAIALRAVGAWVATTANQTFTIPTTPSAPQAGDLMVLFYGTKPYNDAPTIDQSWTNGGAATDGTVAAGIDVGSMQARIFWKVHTGTETNPTVTNGTNNVSSGVIVVFSKDPAKDWDLTFGGGGDATAGTGFSTTSTGTFSFAVNDVVAAFCAIRSDGGTPGTPTLTATSITFSAFDTEPATAFGTQSGGDMAAISGFSTVTAGTAVGNLTFTSTLAAAHTGSSYAVRMREVDPPVAEAFDPMGMMGFFGI